MKLLKFLLKAFAALLALFLIYQLWIFGHIWWWVDHNPATTSFMQEQLADLREDNPDAQLQQKWVAYDQISNNLKRAVIAAEDARFNDHDGFDWQGIQLALEKNRKSGKVVAGGSTITQQLAKNLFLTSSRSWWRKGQEAIITVMLEYWMSKERILEIYLNVIEWGHGIFGAEAAANHYFKTSAARLNQAQAAKLAAMVPNPRFYDQHRSTRYLKRRSRGISRGMGSAQLPETEPAEQEK